jgi:hypothetical protein
MACFSYLLSRYLRFSCKMPGSLRLLQPGQQNWLQGNHVVVGQGQGFEPGKLTKLIDCLLFYLSLSNTPIRLQINIEGSTYCRRNSKCFNQNIV